MIKNFDEFNSSIDEGLGTWLSSAWDWLTGKSQDEDYGKNTETYYKKLQEFIDSKQSIELTKTKESEYSQTIEAIQVGLNFLGYSLGSGGIDGKFSQDTATALDKFNKDIPNIS